MALDVTKFNHVEDTVIEVGFADGCERRVDLLDLVRIEGVFTALREPGFVASGRINQDTGTIEWPGGGDVSPERLYQAGMLQKAGTASARIFPILKHISGRTGTRT